jgi:hypothetical protein
MDIVAQRDFKLNPDTETIECDCMHRNNIKGFGSYRTDADPR